MENVEMSSIKEMSGKLDKLVKWLDYEIEHNYDKNKTNHKNSCNRIKENVLSIFEDLSDEMDKTLEQQIKTYKESEATLQAAQTLYQHINKTLLQFNFGIPEVIKKVPEIIEEHQGTREENKEINEEIEICVTPKRNETLHVKTPKVRDSIYELTENINKVLAMKINIE